MQNYSRVHSLRKPENLTGHLGIFSRRNVQKLIAIGLSLIDYFPVFPIFTDESETDLNIVRCPDW